MVHHLFTTPVVHERPKVAAQDTEKLCSYLLELRARAGGVERSNRGGWHSAGNLFGEEHREFPWLRELVVNAIVNYAGAAMGLKGEFLFQLSGWAVVNGAGNYNVPHNHNPNVISGAYYLRVPEEMRAGEIVFLDPRTNLNASVSPTLTARDQLPPWNKTSLAHAPRPGDLLLFPSWLMHYVNAFTAPDPAALRIVVSFNAAV